MLSDLRGCPLCPDLYIREMYAFLYQQRDQAERTQAGWKQRSKHHAACPYALLGVPTKDCLVARLVLECRPACLVRLPLLVRSGELVQLRGMITAAQCFALVAIDVRGDACEYSQLNTFIDGCRSP